MKKVISVILICTILVLIPCYSVEAISETDIAAPSAVLMEEDSGKVLFAKNENEIRACASITKVMTLLLVMEAIERGELNLDDMLTASEHASSMGGSDIWLKAGEQMSVDDLLKATAVASANDAAVVLAEAVATTEDAFVEMMNNKAVELGMKNTTFKNCNGLDEEGHLTTAYDVALMSKELLKHKKILEYTGIWMDYLRDGKTQIVNTNKLLKSYQGITGLKTGTTSQAGSCIVATAQKNGLSLIAVVLGDKTTAERFSDAKTLLDYGFSSFVKEKPEFNPEDLGVIPVENGMLPYVELYCDEIDEIVVSKDDKNKLTTEVALSETLSAPVVAGQKVGEVLFKIDGKVVNFADIYSAYDVEAISFFNVFELLFKSLIAS